MALFKKVACFTDIHFGMKNGSRIHNNDCEEFVKWFCEEAKKEGCETCIFLGDWHHNRSSVDISTMNYTVSNIELLSNNFTDVFLIMGNHDEYYKDKREIHSLEFGRLFPNVSIVNEMITDGDVSIVPWLVGDEWKKIEKTKSKYMFGHFELPSFYMNAMVQMPDHGNLRSSHFKNQEYVFSGHFHKRQQKGNIVYMGNAFPHNYADAGDDERGMMVLEWGKEPQFRAWPGQPKYRVYKLSEILERPEELLLPKMHCRATIDVELSFEEANFIREQFMPQYNLRELQLIPEKVEVDSQSTTVDMNFESVDTIVMNSLTTLDTETFDQKLLLDLYKDL